jgi:hypothetical protein
MQRLARLKDCDCNIVTQLDGEDYRFHATAYIVNNR